MSPRYRWRVTSPRVPRSLDDLLALVLGNRGVPAAGVAQFLAPPYDAALHDPLLLAQCGTAVSRLKRALTRHESIAVFGDYDVDGITAAALLAEAVTSLGGRVVVELPHRAEGYGLSLPAVERLVPPATLLVTVDNGMSAHAAIAAALARGADVIILDHHAVRSSLPPGALVVHPALPAGRYPNQNLSAVGVAWKVAAVLLAEEGRAGDEKYHLDLVCLGTLADSMVLVGENRTLVSWGLEVLRRSRRPGVTLLCEQLGLGPHALSAHDVTFRIIPRLNAAGRLRHARLAYELLTTRDIGTARRLVAELETVNTERRTLTDDLLRQAKAMVGEGGSGVVVVAGPWPPGILSVLASRLSEEYGRPAVAIGVRDGECTASIRGPSLSGEEGKGVNVMNLLEPLAPLLTRYGGHAGAAGCSFPVTALDAVAAAFRSLPVTAVEPTLVLECPLPLVQVTPELARGLTQLEPHGAGNARPLFLIPGVSVAEARAIGANGDHARFSFRSPEVPAAASGVAFRWGSRRRPVVGDRVDLAAEVRFDTFRGVPRADLHVQDLRAAVTEAVPAAR